MRRLMILVLITGCGRAEVLPQQVAPARFDAGAHDSGMRFDSGFEPDAGVPDAGAPDAGPGCPPPTGPACQFMGPPQSLTCIPGLRLLGSGVDTQGRFLYQLSFLQPLDHDQPNGPTFEQRLSLYHVSNSSPMVMLATGYDLYETTDEVADLFGTNELSIEHRYFGESATDGGNDFSHLDIRQAALDFHRIRVAFAGLYPKPWVSTGASKGGMTMVYYRRFFPCDVGGTVAYVAPHSGAESDLRYNTFLSQVGGTAWADCRARLINLERQLLERRDTLTAMLPHPDSGYSIVGGFDVAIEVSAIDFNFAFWQYTDPSSSAFGCASLPAGLISDSELGGWALSLVGADDQSLRPFAAYYYQAATQLGGPAAFDQQLSALLRYPGKNNARLFIDKAVAVPPFDPQPMRDIQQWLSTQGEGIVFVYGELDPWTAGQFDLGHSTDTFMGLAPGNNHFSAIADLGSSDKQQAIAKIERWLGVKANGGGMFRAPVKRRPPRYNGPPIPGR